MMLLVIAHVNNIFKFACLQLLEEHHDITKQKKLPSIDDEGNQLDVADYVDEIYQYYWVTEV